MCKALQAEEVAMQRPSGRNKAWCIAIENINVTGARGEDQEINRGDTTEGHNKALTFYFKSNEKLLKEFK